MKYSPLSIFQVRQMLCVPFHLLPLRSKKIFHQNIHQLLNVFLESEKDSTQNYKIITAVLCVQSKILKSPLELLQILKKKIKTKQPKKHELSIKQTNKQKKPKQVSKFESVLVLRFLMKLFCLCGKVIFQKCTP